MPAFMVSYEVEPGRDYALVNDVLETVGATRVLGGLWLWEVNEEAEAICNAMMTLLDLNDAVAIFEMKQPFGWATVNVNDRATEWLRAH